MAYSQKNSRGTTYYLNRQQVTLAHGGRPWIYFFSKSYQEETAADLPEGKFVIENLQSGVLLLKKITN